MTDFRTSMQLKKAFTYNEKRSMNDLFNIRINDEFTEKHKMKPNRYSISYGCIIYDRNATRRMFIFAPNAQFSIRLFGADKSTHLHGTMGTRTLPTINRSSWGQLPIFNLQVVIAPMKSNRRSNLACQSLRVPPLTLARSSNDHWIPT